MKLKTLSASVALALGVSIGGAAVASPTFFGLTLFEDDMLRFHVESNAPGSPDYGKISVGDRIIDIWEIQQNSPILVPGSPVSMLPSEFTGISDVVVLTKDAAGSKLVNGVLTPIFNFTFGPNPGGFLAGLGSAGAAVPSIVASAGDAPPASALATAGPANDVVVRFWDDPTPNLNLVGVPSCASMYDCMLAASDGTHYWTAGFAGNPFESVTVDGAPDVPTSLLAVLSSTSVASANFRVSQLPGGAGPDVNLQCLFVFPGCPKVIDVVGTGDIKGGVSIATVPTLVGDGAFSSGDYDFSVDVPEPGTLALLGLGLAGLGLGAGRKRGLKQFV